MEALSPVLVPILVVVAAVIYAVLRERMIDCLNFRISVLEQTLSGPKLARDISLPVSDTRKNLLLRAMDDEALLKTRLRSDCQTIYEIASYGLRMLGEQDR